MTFSIEFCTVFLIFTLYILVIFIFFPRDVIGFNSNILVLALTLLVAWILGLIFIIYV